MSLLAEFYRVLQALEQAAVDYAVCGGMAVTIHGYPRMTNDLDFLVERESIPSIEEALSHVGYNHIAGILPFDSGKSNQRDIFRISKSEDGDIYTIDFLLVSPTYQEAWDSRISVEVGGKKISCVSFNGLIQMKKIAGRPRDLDDIIQLNEKDRANNG